MGSLQAESDLKNELNDSGFAQDEPMIKRQCLENAIKPQLLDLSDDVLLYILKHCAPRDLKSLGYTCSRLGALVLDRTLWERVDARSEPVGLERLSWYMKHALSSSTTELLLSGYAREAAGCLGHMKCDYKEVEKEEKREANTGHWGNGGFTYDPTTRRGIIRGGPVIQIYDTMPSFLDAVYGPPRPDDATCVAVLVSAAGGNAVHIRATCFPLSDAFGPDIGPEWAPPDSSCPGPQYTLTPGLLRDLVALCPAITSLALEYCNIDCTTLNLGHFPRTLKKLSLRGSKCYKQPLDKSFLFKIQDYLTQLEELNVSECNWIEPSSLLPLSKLPALRRLYMRRCCKMTECVAYSSLATRYGFKRLQVIDLRESPVGDSEVSSFGWISSLEELYVSPAPTMPQVVHHAHYIGDVLPEHIELDPWEEQEPEYFKSKQRPNNSDVDVKTDVENDAHSLKRKMATPVVCSCGARNASEETAAKKTKSNGVNEGASTSKWTPTEDPPPLWYFNEKSEGASGSMESEKTESTGTTCTPESAGIESSGTIESFGMEISVTTESPDIMESSFNAESPDTAQKSRMESPGAVSPGTSKSTATLNTSGRLNSPGTSTSPDISESLETLESPGTSQSSGTLKSPGTSKSPGSPGTSKSSGTLPSPGTSKSPGTPKSSGSSKSSGSGPSTSKSPPRNADSARPGSSNQAPESAKLSFQRYIRFRQNQNPVVVDRPEDDNNRNQEPIHKILYVNVGRRLHTMYRLTMPVYAFGDNELMGENARRFDGPFAAPRLDPRTLVSDTTVHRFGRADSDNISYINIGPNGIHHESPGTRPDRSNLRVLSMTGFRNITNRSLVHLATAAPMLRRIDFTGTRVTERGVSNFRVLRPDCEVIFDRDE